MTAARHARGWWRRWMAPSADVDPWPQEFLARLNLEQDAIRKKLRREVRPSRRRAARKADGC